MNLSDIVSRQVPPVPWSEADSIPWHDPDFSRRMLREHLSQHHDAASRRFETIDRHVEWIHRHVLGGKPCRILDLGCGPGLYLQRLAVLGHACTGIDYSPASIAYAAGEASKHGLAILYRQEDMRTAEFGSDFDLVMLIFGELNLFRPSDAECILGKAARSLKDKGIVLLEVHPFEAIRRRGQHRPSWYTSQAGLFSDSPHLCLQESFWDAGTCTATSRYFVIDCATGGVSRHAETFQAYTDDQYAGLLAKCGFEARSRYPSLTGTESEGQRDLVVLSAGKR